MNPPTLTGTVKFFLYNEGYGFISPDGEADPSKDRFFHHSQLNVPRIPKSYKDISQGTRVSFIPVENEKGLAAMCVTPI